MLIGSFAHGMVSPSNKAQCSYISQGKSQPGFKVFLPLIIKTAAGVKFVNKFKPLFPGYLFLGTEPENIPWNSINSTRGVSKAVTLDGQYRSVASEIIEGLKSRCDQHDNILSLDEIATGDRVKIERGPFTDFICNVEKLMAKGELGY